MRQVPLAWPVPVGLAASRVLAPRLRPGPVRHISAASSLCSSPVRASHISEVFHCRLIFLSTNPAVLPSPSPAGQVQALARVWPWLSFLQKDLLVLGLPQPRLQTPPLLGLSLAQSLSSLNFSRKQCPRLALVPESHLQQ